MFGVELRGLELQIRVAAEHSHTTSALYGPGSGAGGIGTGNQVSTENRVTVNPAGNHTHLITGNTGSAGSGEAHENRPPYYALCFIRKN
ncbi:MAG: hypothetical protein R3197_00275 [Paracoccaceae bacterium]|nr:hypothetical protein [Paracoccaceae bacterium]